MNTKLKSIVLFLFVIGSSCFAQTKTNSIESEREALQLVTKNCYSCHNPNSDSHDEIIAPPMIAVKNRYLREYNTEKAFIDAVVSYAKNPKQSKALMKGAVQKFKVMPQQNFSKTDLQKIANYIYNNPIKEPEWFNNHFENEHKNHK